MSGKAVTPVPAQRRSWFWLQGAVVGAVVVLMPGAALLLSILLAPAIIAFIADPAPGRPLARSMGCLGVASSVLPLRTLLHGGMTVDAGLAGLSEPLTVLAAWVACGCGWLIAELAQLAHTYAVKSRTRRTIEHLEQERQALAEEWSLPGSRPAEPGRPPQV